MSGQTWIVAVAGAVLGALAGGGLRVLLGRLPRGAAVRRGVLEGSSAAVTAGAALVGWGTPLLPLLVWAGWTGLALGAVDLLRHRLPDALTGAALAGSAVVIMTTQLAWPGTGGLLRAVLCAAGVWLLFALLRLVSRGGMGAGDVKYASAIGLLTGYVSLPATVVAVVATFLLGALVALVGLALRRMRLSSTLPFGPFMAAGCWIALALAAAA